MARLIDFKFVKNKNNKFAYIESRFFAMFNESFNENKNKIIIIIRAIDMVILFLI